MNNLKDSRDFIQMIDASCLKPESDEALVRQTCLEALKYGYAAVFIMSAWLPLSANLLKGSRVKVGAAIGFPLGSHLTAVKVCEAREAIASGAEEIDIMLNVGALKSRDYSLVERDLQAVVEASQGRLTKVILETCLLSDEEKRIACKIAEDAGANFVKTSTGFGSRGATAADVRLMRDSVSERVRVKAAGGIDTLEQVWELHQSGAVRFGIGTSKAANIAAQILAA